MIAVAALLLTGGNFLWDHRRTEHSDSFQAEELLNDAWKLIRQRELESASDQVALAGLKDPRNARVDALRGYLQALRKGHLPAIDHYQAALALEPDYVVALIFLGDSLREEKRFEDAERRLKQALRVAKRHNPQDVTLLGTIHLSLGNLRQAELDPGAASELYRRACHLDPSNLEARAAYARSLVERNQLWEAFDQYEILIALDPLDAENWGGFGWLLYLLERYQGAEVALRRALELSPQRASYRLLSLTLREQGRMDEADAVLAQSWHAHDLLSVEPRPTLSP